MLTPTANTFEVLCIETPPPPTSRLRQPRTRAPYNTRTGENTPAFALNALLVSHRVARGPHTAYGFDVNEVIAKRFGVTPA
jgi:hypothetical protein